MKVWITKYALTRGILERDGDICEGNTNLFRVTNKYPEYYHGGDWHKTEEAARAKAEKMRLLKIKSLKKSLDNLEKMKF